MCFLHPSFWRSLVHFQFRPRFFSDKFASAVYERVQIMKKANYALSRTWVDITQKYSLYSLTQGHRSIAGTFASKSNALIFSHVQNIILGMPLDQGCHIVLFYSFFDMTTLSYMRKNTLGMSLLGMSVGYPGSKSHF